MMTHPYFKFLVLLVSFPLHTPGNAAVANDEPDSATFVTLHQNVALEKAVYDRIDPSSGRIVETDFLVIKEDDIFMRGKSLIALYFSAAPESRRTSESKRTYVFPVVCNGRICILHAPDTTSHLLVNRATRNACEGFDEDDQSGTLQKTIFFKVAKVNPATVRRLYFFCDTSDTPIYPPLADPWILEASMAPPNMNGLKSNNTMMEKEIIRLCRDAQAIATRDTGCRDFSKLDSAIYLTRYYYFVSDTAVKYKIFMTFYFFNQDLYRITFSDLKKDASIRTEGKKGATSGRKKKKKPAVIPPPKEGYPRMLYDCSEQLLSRAPFRHDTLEIRNPDGSWVTDLEGRTLLTYACQHNQSPERVKMLVKAGLPANHKDRHGKSPRHYCIESGNKKLLKLLPR